MSRYTVKVYVVQKADPVTHKGGEILAAKLTYADAHKIAKDFAPAKVTCLLADKSDLPNAPDAVVSRDVRN